MDEKKIPKVFISYAWQNSDRVLELAQRLMHNGVDVILDKWDLKEGNDKYAFMEQSVNKPDVDRVLIICDRFYTEKANAREGGVGDETVIISPEIYGHVEQEKFIPIIFEVDENSQPYCPSYIKSRIYIDLSTEDEKYEENYEKLLRNIHNKPLHRKPSLGSIPEWLENETIDFSEIRDLIKQIRRCTNRDENKIDSLVRNCSDEFITAFNSFNSTSEDMEYDKELLAKIDQERTLRDLYIDYLDTIISSNLSIDTIVPAFFEQLYNSTHDTSGTYRMSLFEFYDFSLWELLICTTAVLLHYERFKDLYEILTHTYFLRETFSSSYLKHYNYTKFREYFKTLENKCKLKSTNPNLLTLTGNILVNREKKPIITQETLSNADIVLYQLSQAYDLKGEGHSIWFPVSYIYCHMNQILWYKMKSKAYCDKILPLFGVTSIDQLKQVIEKCNEDREIRYNNAYTIAPSITTYIKPEEIAELH